jgi:hypothetical protein
MSTSTSPDVTVEELLVHAGWARRLAVRLTGGDDSADDLVQKTWIAAARHPPAGDPSGQPVPEPRLRPAPTPSSTPLPATAGACAAEARALRLHLQQAREEVENRLSPVEGFDRKSGQTAHDP